MQGLIRSIPDYPNPGVTFRDITPLLGDGPAFNEAITKIAERFVDANIQRVIGVEARGFILGAVVLAVTGGHMQIGAVEGGGVHAHQHVVRSDRGHRDGGQLRAIGRHDDGFHDA